MKTAISGMRKRRRRDSCFWPETFRDFYRLCVPPNPQRAGGLPRSGKSRENFGSSRETVEAFGAVGNLTPMGIGVGGQIAGSQSTTGAGLLDGLP
ncbi:hypothetical protein, partial [Burkholderia cenocepacia]|uniref:hypothetical protein n=1 Tax=Burkholderia cenocepacia TaxID=95486 RepID=UPI001C0B323F